MGFYVNNGNRGWVCGNREPISCPIYRFLEEKKDSEKIEELLREYIENKWSIKFKREAKEMKLNMRHWNEIFKEKGEVFLKVQPDMQKVVKLFKKYKVKKVLDLGCGSGRHVVYLAKNGFEVYGIDIAKHGIKLAKNWLKKENLKGSLQVGDIYQNLPYKNNSFDVIVSTTVIHHNRIEKIRKLIKEMERILRPGGLIFITVRGLLKIKKWKKGRVFIHSYKVRGKIRKVPLKIVGEHLYTYIDGEEKGLLHFVFTKELIRKEFKNFKIERIWSRRGSYCFLGALKS